MHIIEIPGKAGCRNCAVCMRARVVATTHRPSAVLEHNELHPDGTVTALAAHICRSWYILFFYCPWLPEFLLRAADLRFLEAAFKDGPMAVRTPGAMTPTDIEWYKRAFGAPGALTGEPRSNIVQSRLNRIQVRLPVQEIQEHWQQLDRWLVLTPWLAQSGDRSPFRPRLSCVSCNHVAAGGDSAAAGCPFASAELIKQCMRPFWAGPINYYRAMLDAMTWNPTPGWIRYFHIPFPGPFPCSLRKGTRLCS